MYMEGHAQYKYHLNHFGHPSEYGYKDICNNWVIDRWKPDELMDLFVEMGARYFMAMGVHHRRSPTSSCGAWMTPLPSIIPM
jgi:alpha-L-fucosidase